MRIPRPPVPLVLALSLLMACGESEAGRRTPISTTLTVQDILGGGSGAEFERALGVRPFRFPEDHGPHPSFRSEWWYVTGNLRGSDGSPLGFQLTFFRSALAPGAPPLGSSPWRTRQLYMAHLALTDGGEGTYLSYERFSRSSVGLAGAQARPFRVWLEDWELRGTEKGFFPMTLRARNDSVGLDLVLTSEKPLVLQGDRGLSRKGPEPGNASYYYSFSRLRASGSVTFPGAGSRTVQGSAWMDREWSSGALGADQSGWDWFALQLDDGWELMLYTIRKEGGGMDRSSEALLVDPRGEGVRIPAHEIGLTVMDRWRSSVDGTEYPARWRVSLPGQGTTLEVTPLIPDQEFHHIFRYWEGAVRVNGTRKGRPVSGVGYVELTGYGPPSSASPAQVRSGRTGNR